MDRVYEVGDRIELVNKSVKDNPPVGTTGIILELYGAVGGAAATILWDDSQYNNNEWHECVLLKDVSLFDPIEIDESDASISVLFGGAV
mgnify:CR=1 FL=1